MEQYAGIDVSLESSSVCVMDAAGRVVREGKVASEPEALIAWLRRSGVDFARIGLEAGPLSQWLHAHLREAGFAVELLETRHVRAAFRTLPVKTDRKDAAGIAQLMRLGWFRPVHCKSMAAQELRAILTARKLIQGKLHDAKTSWQDQQSSIFHRWLSTDRRRCPGGRQGRLQHGRGLPLERPAKSTTADTHRQAGCGYENDPRRGRSHIRHVTIQWLAFTPPRRLQRRAIRYLRPIGAGRTRGSSSCPKIETRGQAAINDDVGAEHRG